MINKKLGTFQKRILWRLNKNPTSIDAIHEGYSKQEKKLVSRKLIKKIGNKYHITSKGKKIYQNSKTKLLGM